MMVYRPVTSDPTASRLVKLGRSGAFYMGFSRREIGWEPAMLRGVSRGEVMHLEKDGLGSIEFSQSLRG